MAARRYQLRTDLIRRGRAACGYENNTSVADSGELDDQVDVAARLLLDIFLDTYGPDPYRTENDYAIVAGTTIYDLNQDTYEVLGVYAAGQTGPEEAVVPVLPWVKLPTFAEQDRLALLNCTSGPRSSLRYSLRGAGADGVNEDRDQIELLPAPTEDGLLKVVYIPSPVLAAVGEEPADVRVFAPGASGEWIVCYLGAYIRNKEKDDPGLFIGKMQSIEATVRAYASRRDKNEPRRMRGRTRASGGGALIAGRGGDYAEDWEG